MRFFFSENLIDLLGCRGGIGGGWISLLISSNWKSSSMIFFMARLDLKELIDIASYVIGLIPFFWSQSIIAVRSYVWQSEPITGSMNISCVIGHWREFRFWIKNDMND